MEWKAKYLALIGPKRFDVPWKEIEAQGYIAPAECVEVRVNLTEAERIVVRNCRTRRTLSLLLNYSYKT
jgi:superfamily II DNA or RNA helicase